MDRRRFLLISLAGALAAPLAAEAQQAGKVYRVGWLVAALRIPAASASLRPSWRDFEKLGYVEGRNIAMEFRLAEGELERLPELANELVRLKVDVILAGGTAGASRQGTRPRRFPS